MNFLRPLRYTMGWCHPSHSYSHNHTKTCTVNIVGWQEKHRSTIFEQMLNAEQEYQARVGTSRNKTKNMNGDECRTSRKIVDSNEVNKWTMPIDCGFETIENNFSTKEMVARTVYGESRDFIRINVKIYKSISIYPRMRNDCFIRGSQYNCWLYFHRSCLTILYSVYCVMPTPNATVWW